MSNPKNVALALAVVITAVILQSTLLADSRLQIFGSVPSLAVLGVIAVVRYLDPEPAVLIGFTTGLLVDLLGGQPIGLWAMVLTVVAYVALHLRERADDGAFVIAVGVFALTFMAGALWVVVGTVFGLKPLTDPATLRRVILPAIYNVVVAGAVLPGVTILMRPRPRPGALRGWAR